MSVALMAMVMNKLGVPAVSLNAFQVAMHTTSVHGNARLKRIDKERIRRELDGRKIVIVTGFQELINMMIIQRLDAAARIRRQLHWQRRFMRMHAKFTRMWMVFIRLTRARFRQPES